MVRYGFWSQRTRKTNIHTFLCLCLCSSHTRKQRRKHRTTYIRTRSTAEFLFFCVWLSSTGSHWKAKKKTQRDIRTRSTAVELLFVCLGSSFTQVHTCGISANAPCIISISISISHTCPRIFVKLMFVFIAHAWTKSTLFSYILTDNDDADFENFRLGMWTNSHTDNLNWQFHKYFTKTMNTGPDRDHTSGKGNCFFFVLFIYSK